MSAVHCGAAKAVYNHSMDPGTAPCRAPAACAAAGADLVTGWGLARMQKEIELKFGVVREITDFKERCALVGSTGPFSIDTLTNTYFDTRDLDMLGLHCGLRIRHGRDFSEQTIKFKGSNLGGMHIREEYNLPIERRRKKPDLTAFDPRIFPRDFNIRKVNEKLEKQCEITFERQFLDVEFEGCVLEFSYDRGQIKANSQTMPIHEFEVELKEAAADVDINHMFYKLSLALTRARFPLSLEPFSKMHKASLLLNRRDSLNLPMRKYDLININDSILDCVAHYETLFGLLMHRRDLFTLGYANTALRVIVRYLRLYREFAHASKYDTSANIEEIRMILGETLKSVRRFYKFCRRLEKAVYRMPFEDTMQELEQVVAKIRLQISKSDLYNLTLKLRYVLSLN